MKKHFSGPGQGDTYSWWERCRSALEQYNTHKNRGKNIGHPLTSAHAVGKDRYLLRPLSTKEQQAAYALAGFDVS